MDTAGPPVDDHVMVTGCSLCRGVADVGTGTGPGPPEQQAEELGDVLFVLVNWARWLKVEPETALREANAKFYRRFRYIEQQVRGDGKQLSDHTLEELDALWEAAKGEGL